MSKRVIRVNDLTSHGGKMFASGAPNLGVDGIAVALVGAHVPAPKMTTLDIYFSSHNGVLRTGDQVLVFPGLARSEFDRGLGQCVFRRS
nr:hypothetical protein [uncultured Massilia sp.]